MVLLCPPRPENATGRKHLCVSCLTACGKNFIIVAIVWCQPSSFADNWILEKLDMSIVPSRQCYSFCWGHIYVRDSSVCNLNCHERNKKRDMISQRDDASELKVDVSSATEDLNCKTTSSDFSIYTSMYPSVALQKWAGVFDGQG